jgi:hypothetical protein
MILLACLKSLRLAHKKDNRKAMEIYVFGHMQNIAMG